MSLRKINSLEVNKQIQHLPDSVYGYSYGHSFRSISKNSGNDFSKLVVQKRNPDESERRFFFEVRKYSATDVRLAGYISDETHLSYSNVGLTENEIIVFPQEYQEYRNQIEIQLINNPLCISDRSIEFDDISALTILEVSKLLPQANTAEAKKLSSEKTTVQSKEISTQDGSFFKQILLHKYWSLLIVFFILLIVYKVFGVSPKDLIP